MNSPIVLTNLNLCVFIIDKQEIVNLRRSQAGWAWEEKEGDGINTVLISGIFQIKVKKEKQSPRNART